MSKRSSSPLVTKKAWSRRPKQESFTLQCVFIPFEYLAFYPLNHALPSTIPPKANLVKTNFETNFLEDDFESDTIEKEEEDQEEEVKYDPKQTLLMLYTSQYTTGLAYLQFFPDDDNGKRSARKALYYAWKELKGVDEHSNSEDALNIWRIMPDGINFYYKNPQLYYNCTTLRNNLDAAFEDYVEGLKML